MSAFSITSPRSTVIDYSAPYYYSGFALLGIKRDSAVSRYFFFLEPFPAEIWLLILLCAFVTFVCLVRIMRANLSLHMWLTGSYLSYMANTSGMLIEE